MQVGNGKQNSLKLFYTHVRGDDVDEITNTKTLLNEKFNIKDLGVLKYFLGFEVSRSKEGSTLCQRKYTPYTLTHTFLNGVKPFTTHM